jgi:phosphate starvation-inducible PhoH-like protein
MGKKKKTQSIIDESIVVKESPFDEWEVAAPRKRKVCYKVKLKCKNQKQKEYAKMIDSKEIIFATGSAGCGKTYVAVIKALELLKEDNNFDKIYLITSSLPSEENLGLLPGNVDEKLLPSMMSFLIVIDEIIGKEERERLFKDGLIEFMPISYLRGVNLKNCIILADEMQNLTIRGMKTLLTRLATNSVAIISGDVEQIDNPKLNKNNSGLTYIIDKVKEKPDDRIGVIEFGEEHVVRNPIINVLLEYFE